MFARDHSSSGFFRCTDYFSMMPNWLVDEYLPRLGSALFILLTVILRETAGWQCTSTTLSQRRLEESSGLSNNTVANGLRRLRQEGLISLAVERNPLCGTITRITLHGRLLAAFGGGEAAPAGTGHQPVGAGVAPDDAPTPTGRDDQETPQSKQKASANPVAPPATQTVSDTGVPAADALPTGQDMAAPPPGPRGPEIAPAAVPAPALQPAPSPPLQTGPAAPPRKPQKASTAPVSSPVPPDKTADARLLAQLETVGFQRGSLRANGTCEFLVEHYRDYIPDTFVCYRAWANDGKVFDSPTGWFRGALKAAAAGQPYAPPVSLRKRRETQARQAEQIAACQARAQEQAQRIEQAQAEEHTQQAWLAGLPPQVRASLEATASRRMAADYPWLRDSSPFWEMLLIHQMQQLAGQSVAPILRAAA